MSLLCPQTLPPSPKIRSMSRLHTEAMNSLSQTTCNSGETQGRGETRSKPTEQLFGVCFLQSGVRSVLVPGLVDYRLRRQLGDVELDTRIVVLVAVLQVQEEPLTDFVLAGSIEAMPAASRTTTTTATTTLMFSTTTTTTTIAVAGLAVNDDQTTTNEDSHVGVATVSRQCFHKGMTS